MSISEAREGFIGRDLVGLGECNHGDDQSWSIFLEREKVGLMRKHSGPRYNMILHEILFSDRLSGLRANENLSVSLTLSPRYKVNTFSEDLALQSHPLLGLGQNVWFVHSEMCTRFLHSF